MKPHTHRFQPFLLGAMIICQIGTSSAPAQSNIVVNGGFELWGVGWEVSSKSSILTDPFGSAGGTNELIVRDMVAQDLSTVAGRDYLLQFAYRSFLPSVTWGGTPIAQFTNLYTLGASWRYVYCYARAETDVTRLVLQSELSYLDDVKVGWLREPVSILEQPGSRTAYEGATVSLVVNAQGGPPLCYQWMFNDVPILQATNPALTLAPVRAIQAGNYSVLVSNVAGSLMSTTAALNVEPSSGGPVIVMQPESRTLPAGYGGSLNAAAVGSPPLAYQWRQNDTNLAAATNSSLVFDAVQSTNAGSYTVCVSNSLGTTLSLPAVLTVTNANGGGWIRVTNTTPIYDVDGLTRLAGPNYFSQAYAGPSATLLRPLGPRTPLRTNNYAGFIVAPFVKVPDVAVNGSVYVQLRAWEAACGASYEAARAVGGKFGFSEIILTTAKSGSVWTLMQGFTLRAGLPFFYTGRLAVTDSLPDGTPQMILYGQTGFRYLIEKQSPPNNWLPFLVVTNVTGTVVFPRAEPASDAVEFYRSRMLD